MHFHSSKIRFWRFILFPWLYRPCFPVSSGNFAGICAFEKTATSLSSVDWLHKEETFISQPYWRFWKLLKLSMGIHLLWASVCAFPAGEVPQLLFQELVISCSLGCSSVVLQAFWCLSSTLFSRFQCPQGIHPKYASALKVRWDKSVSQAVFRISGMFSIHSALLLMEKLRIGCLLLITLKCTSLGEGLQRVKWNGFLTRWMWLFLASSLSGVLQLLNWFLEATYRLFRPYIVKLVSFGGS